MKTRLIFEAENLEDSKDISKIFQFRKYISVIQDLDAFLRAQIKYGDRHEYQPIRDKLWELIKEEEIENMME